MPNAHHSHARTTIMIVLILGMGVFKDPATLLSQENSSQRTSGKVYEIDAKISRVYVKVEPDGRGHAHGVEGRFISGSGALGSGEKLGELVIDLASFTADDPEARRCVGLDTSASDFERRSVTRTMLGPQVLDTQRYPTAACTITSISPSDNQAVGEPGSYQVEGKLVLHGVTRPVRFQAKVERAEAAGAFRVRGALWLLQTDYKITPYSGLLGTVRVKDALRVFGDVILAPKSAK